MFVTVTGVFVGASSTWVYEKYIYTFLCVSSILSHWLFNPWTILADSNSEVQTRFELYISFTATQYLIPVNKIALG